MPHSDQFEIRNPKSEISLIAAMAENRVIGAEGTLPWHLPADLKRFKALTMGHPILMGRKTYESIGRPLPQRRNLVLTRQREWSAPGTETVQTLDEALGRIEPGEELFVIGGEQVYRLALPRAKRLYLTLVHTQVAGDAVFPPFDVEQWHLREQEDRPADERNAHAMTFLCYERRDP